MSTTDEPEDFGTVLLDDVIAAVGRMEDHPRERRFCVRAIFAAVEGHLAAVTQELISKASTGLSETEKMALREETYRVEPSGKIVTIPAHQPLKQRVRLVTAIVKRLHPEYQIDFESDGWRQLLAALDVRDRLTHPKSLKDLTVEDAELRGALDGGLWFLRNVISPGHKGIHEWSMKNVTPALGSHAHALGVTLSELLGVKKQSVGPEPKPESSDEK